MNKINELKNQFIDSELDKIDDFIIAKNIFKQLSDTNRLRIFWLLCHKETCVINISKTLKMSPPSISHHLTMLKNENLITLRRQGKIVYYKVSNTKQSELLHRTLDEILRINCSDIDKIRLVKCQETEKKLMENKNSQIDFAKKIHDYLMDNLDKHITIEELSKKFLSNSTTLKKIFKNIYGTSLANHIKFHRLEKAAELLKKSEQSIARIAKQVGYESQSKFTRAFKETYGVVPREFRIK